MQHDQRHAQADHAENRRHLDQGEPEFQLAIEFYLNQVDGGNPGQHQKGREPLWEIRQPVVDVDAHYRELGHAHGHIEKPVIPAGEEAGEFAPIRVGEVAECAAHGFGHGHFAHHAHDQPDHGSAQQIGQQHGRPGQGDGGGGTVEQAGADGPAQRDHLDMPVFQPALQFPAGLPLLILLHAALLAVKRCFMA